MAANFTTRSNFIQFIGRFLDISVLLIFFCDSIGEILGPAEGLYLRSGRG